MPHPELTDKKRNLCFIGPDADYFRLTFVCGERAVQKVQESKIPTELIRELTEAKKYAEVRGLHQEIREPRQMEILKELVAIKIKF